jgi:hypothetical protein
MYSTQTIVDYKSAQLSYNPLHSAQKTSASLGLSPKERPSHGRLATLGSILKPVLGPFSSFHAELPNAKEAFQHLPYFVHIGKQQHAAAQCSHTTPLRNVGQS